MKGLERQPAVSDRLVQPEHDFGARRPVELPLELVEKGVSIARGLVAEVVHEPRESVDGAEMGAG